MAVGPTGLCRHLGAPARGIPRREEQGIRLLPELSLLAGGRGDTQLHVEIAEESGGLGC